MMRRHFVLDLNLKYYSTNYVQTHNEVEQKYMDNIFPNFVIPMLMYTVQKCSGISIFFILQVKFAME